jgi:endonuclease YncB( thermonuclease family)
MKRAKLLLLAALVVVCLVVASWRRSPTVMNPAWIQPSDGDTIIYRDEPIRVVGIDTPELRHEEYGFKEDQPFGPEAARMTAEILASAEKIEYLSCGKDRYGRTLAYLFVDGELLAVKLIRAGLAYETISFYGDNGYPELGLQILQAAEEGPKPEFEPPWKWKQRQRRKR